MLVQDNKDHCEVATSQLDVVQNVCVCVGGGVSSSAMGDTEFTSL